MSAPILPVTDARIARNALLSLSTAVAPAFVGLLTMPYVIRGLGKEAFGVLSLAWVVLGVFAILDFGASRATTKRVAESRAASEEHQVGAIVWTAMAVNGVTALFSASLLVAGSSLLVERLLKIPPALQQDALVVFWILCLTIPPSLTSGVLRSALEGAHRFDVTTFIQVPANALNFVWPVVIVAMGGGIVPIVIVICATRFALVPVFFLAVRREFSGFRRPRFDKVEAAFLIRFGGWLTISSVVGPILLNLDRLMVGSLLGVRSVAFYAAPYEMVSRLTMIPASLMSALFPALSSFAATDAHRFVDAYQRTLRYLLILMTPLCGLLVAFAPDILGLWLGREFAEESSAAVRILAFGLLALSLGSLPFNALQAIGKADVAAKIHAIELLPYVLLAWQLVSHFGIVGAATAWSLRAAGDAFLFHVAARRTGAFGTEGPSHSGSTVLVLLLASAAVLLAAIVRESGAPWVVGSIAIAVLGMAYMAVTWRYILEPSDRTLLRGMLRSSARTGA